MRRLPAPAGALAALARRPLERNALYLWGASLCSSAGGAVFWTVVAHTYPAPAVGVGAATIAALTLLSTLTHLGLGDALVRWLPSHNQDRPALINTALTLAAAAGAAATVVFLLGVRAWSPGIAYLARNPGYFGSFAVFVMAASAGSVVSYAFVARRDARHVLTMGLALEAARLALCLPLLFLGGFGLVAATGLGAVASLAAGLRLLPRAEPGYTPRPALRWEAMAQLAPFGLANHAADLAMALPNVLLPIMVINTLGPTDSAHFYIGFVMGALLLTSSQALATSLFAEGSASEEILGPATRRALGWALALAGLGVAVLFALAGRLLLIFGSGYSAASASLVRVVALAALPGTVTYICLSVLRVRRRLWQLVGLAWAVCFVTLVAGQALMPHLGIVGAGAGLVAGQSLGALLCLCGVLRQRTHPAARAPGLDADTLVAPSPTRGTRLL